MPNGIWDDTPEESYEGEYSITRMEDNGTGGKVKVTRYADGSSTVHWGGPCGPMHYDKFGEEC